MSDSFTSSRRSAPISDSYSSTAQVEQVLDSVFADLEQDIKVESGWDLDPNEYPYADSRPPLRSRRPPTTQGGLLMAIMMAAAVLTGVTFWLTTRPQTVSPLSPAAVMLPTDEDADKAEDGGATPLDFSHFDMDILGSQEIQPQEEITAATKAQEPQGIDPAVSPRTGAQGSPSSSHSSPSASQGPVAAAAAATPVPQTSIPFSALPRSAPQMKLVGIVHEPGPAIALILVDDVVREVPVGHAVQSGWQVTSIVPQGVAVTDGYKSYLLQLGLGRVL